MDKAAGQIGATALTGDNIGLLGLTAEIVSAFVSNNAVHAAELPDIIKAVHASLAAAAVARSVPAEPPTPAVPIKKSITDDYLVCLEDGQHFRSLKRHLRTKFGLTPNEYRARWGLPSDYPMVAPGYAALRSALAKSTGLGRSLSETEPAAPETAPMPVNDASVVAQPSRRKAAAKRAAVAPTTLLEPEPPVAARGRGRPKKRPTLAGLAVGVPARKKRAQTSA